MCAQQLVPTILKSRSWQVHTAYIYKFLVAHRDTRNLYLVSCSQRLHGRSTVPEFLICFFCVGDQGQLAPGVFHGRIAGLCIVVVFCQVHATRVSGSRSDCQT